MKFEPNRPVSRREPTVTVDAGLPVGRHRFRLEVVNRRGQRSKAAEVIVIIERAAPEPIPTPNPLHPL